MAQASQTPSPKTTPTVQSTPPSALPPTGAGTNPPSTPHPAKEPKTNATNAPNTPGGRPGPHVRRTPGSIATLCTADKAAFKVVTVHTAKCTECDQRNLATMLRCPGCTFQICKPCRDRREKKGTGLSHGTMSSPGGLFGTSALGSGILGRSGGLGSGSGSVTRKKLPGMVGNTSPSPVPSNRLAKLGEGKIMESFGLQFDGTDDSMDREKGLGSGLGLAKPAAMPAAKPASKKRAAKVKSKTTVEDESTDDEFMPDTTSPTATKRCRTTHNLTDTPTATSARPSRKPSAPTAYVAPASPESEGAVEPDVRGPPPMASLSTAQPQIATQGVVQLPQSAFLNRIQELLEEHGVNTPGNRYQEHFLGRQMPVFSNPVIEMPPSFTTTTSSRSGDHQAQSNSQRDAQPVRAHSSTHKAPFTNTNTTQPHPIPPTAPTPSTPLTVRAFAEASAPTYHRPALTTDETDELLSALLATSRKWANNVYDKHLPVEQKQLVQRGLNMRLDVLDGMYKEDLAKAVDECARGKVREFEEDGEKAFV